MYQSGHPANTQQVQNISVLRIQQKMYDSNGTVYIIVFISIITKRYDGFVYIMVLEDKIVNYSIK